MLSSSHLPSPQDRQASTLSIMKLSVRFSFTFRSAATRWSYGANWRSPASLRAQIRIAIPLIDKFEQKFASMASVDCHKGILTNLAKPGDGNYRTLHSFSALNDPRIDKLPYSIRILLESAIRNRDSFQVTKDDIEKIIDWENTSYKQVENPFKPARILLKDFTGVPATVDLAAMRDAINNLGNDPNKINPLSNPSVQIYDAK